MTDDKTPMAGDLLGPGSEQRRCSFARDGSTRAVYGYRAVAYNTPRGSVFGYMPELKVSPAAAGPAT